MKIFKKSSVRGAMLVAATATLISPITAHAIQDDGDGTCSTLDYCATTDAAFGGSLWTWYGDDNIWPSIISNKDDSGWNRSGTYYVRVYDDTGFSGRIYCIAPGVMNSLLSPGNRGSSHTWNSSC